MEQVEKVLTDAAKSLTETGKKKKSRRPGSFDSLFLLLYPLFFENQPEKRVSVRCSAATISLQSIRVRVKQ